ncbi:MAG TPA: AtpZ/AtpI family protein [Stellaceae bacterium]|nr:AtpZ/AtpI family protein [Stellaceae bacterium]
MNEREKNDPLRDLGERLDKARAARPKSPERAADNTSTGNALALGWRVGIELVGAIVVAVFIGWAFDQWLGTRPWGMVVMFFLGVAAGMLNVYRTVTGLGRAVGFKQDAPSADASIKTGAGWDDDED